MSEDLFQRAKRHDLVSFLERELAVKPVIIGSSVRFPVCPHCGGRKGSVRLSILHSDGYKCHSCGEGGSIIDAASALWKVSVVEAAKILAGEEVMPAASHIPVISNEEKIVQNEALIRVFQILRPILTRRDDSVCENYLVSQRKLNPAVLKEARQRGMLGYLPGNPLHAKNFLVKHVGRDLLVEAGLWRSDSKAPGIAYRPIVSFLPCGKSVEFRKVVSDDKGAKTIRYGALTYPWFWRGAENAQRALVVEGVIDMFSAITMDWKEHIIGLPGCNNFNLDWFGPIAAKWGIEKYLIALDNDVENPKNPGQKWAGKLAEGMSGLNLTHSLYVPPVGDLNDVLRSRAVAA